MHYGCVSFCLSVCPCVCLSVRYIVLSHIVFRSVARSSIPHFVCPSVADSQVNIFKSYILQGLANSWKYVATQNIMYGHMIGGGGLPSSSPLPSSSFLSPHLTSTPLHSPRLTTCSHHAHNIHINKMFFPILPRWCII